MAKKKKIEQAPLVSPKQKIKVKEAANAFMASNQGAALTGAVIGMSTLGITALLFFH